MKLDYKKTFFVGTAFLLISLFWQAYDAIVPRILVSKFGMNQTLSGVIMALDNILAVFMLPLFGHLSDRTKTKIGKRTPYIIIGTLLAAVFFVSSTFADNVQLSKLQGVTGNDFLASEILDEESLKIDGIQILDYMEKEGITIDDFVNMSPDDENYFLVTAARNAYAWRKTLEDPVPIVMFIILLFLVLVSMSIFRSPAVALMPDVTIKPLRSKANAVINLMGAVGGMLAIGVGIILGTDKTSYMSYTWYFTAVAVLMLVFLGIFLLKVKERKLLEEVELEKKKYGLTDEEEEEKESGSGEKLSGAKLRSLILLLASVFLWFMAYNAVTSKFSVYADNVLNMGYNLPLLIAQGVAIVTFIPIGIIASKAGRKKCILAGIIILTCAFTAAYFVTPKTTILMYFVFILAGLGWASINVNSYPMVVEMSKGSNIGRYTGFYYTASMAAQVVTPILSGFIMDLTSMRMLFPYAVLFSVLALLTMFFVMHGDNKPQEMGIEVYDVD